nr:MAG TPA: hypothetical protein [Caudoviricetes sp.]
MRGEAEAYTSRALSRAIARSKISKEKKGCELRNGHRRCLFRLRTT